MEMISATLSKPVLRESELLKDLARQPEEPRSDADMDEGKS
jgi:hypothetical protein